MAVLKVKVCTHEKQKAKGMPTHETVNPNTYVFATWAYLYEKPKKNLTQIFGKEDFLKNM